MKYHSIEKEHTYTELSKYNKMNIKTLENVFKQRFLDWKFYLEKAEKEKFSCYLGNVTVIDILTEDLQFFDDCIKNFFIENENSKTIKEIFELWFSSQENKKYFVFKN